YGWPKIFFYRCTRPSEPRLIDPAQFDQVDKFFAEFRPDGAHPGMYKTYETVRQFSELAYDDLLAFIQSISAPSPLTREAAKAISAITGEQAKPEITPAKDLVMKVIEQIEQLNDNRGT